MPVKLSNATLKELPDSVRVPSYDRSKLTPGIVHIGVGNFHRAHQAMYLHKLFEAGKGRDWALVGAGVMEGDRKAREIMAAQDYLTTLVEQKADSAVAYITGPMIDYVEPANATAILSALSDPAIRIVSLTVTEGGYYLDSKGKFNPKHPAIAADAANPDAPKTLFGLIVAGLRARRDAGTAPFTVMCCDNIPHNGNVTKGAVCGMAQLSDPELAEWISQNVSFPNSMVDRITPATSERERNLVRSEYGVEDNWPVFCEDFAQWVMEDKFVNGRPPLEEVGVQFVPDVAPYETMKLRILNGGHATIAYASGLLGVNFANESMEHPVIRPYLDKVENEEIIPSVPPVPDTDLAEYYALIARRFSNPKVADNTRRLCFDGSNKQAKFILDSARDGLKAGRDVSGLALQNALWCRYCFGTRDDGSAIEANDPAWADLTAAAKVAKDDPQSWLEQRQYYAELADDPRFAEPFAKWLRMIWDEGLEKTLSAYLKA